MFNLSCRYNKKFKSNLSSEDLIWLEMKARPFNPGASITRESIEMHFKGVECQYFDDLFPVKKIYSIVDSHVGKIFLPPPFIAGDPCKDRCLKTSGVYPVWLIQCGMNFA